MASDVQQNYYEWKHEQKGSQEPSISQMMDHGSISFGRFAFEPLSWEKRSVFTHNERQEELEKVKSPGLVAKKKAYFEEYYKKIRALKVLQNQQTELSLEYGADGSISSQTGDEDDPPQLLSSSPNEMPESISKAPLEGLTGPGSVENCAAEETIEPHRSHSEMEKEENHNNCVKIQSSNPEYVVRRLSTGSSEEIERNEKSHCANLLNENDTCLKMEPGLTRPLVCSTDPTVLNAVVEKNKLTVHKPKEDSSSVPMSKEHAASNRYLSKSVKKSVPESKKSSLPSNRVHKIEKADIDIPSSKKSYSKARSSDKSSFVASHRLPTELQNKVSILRSNSKVTNKSSSTKLNPEGKLKLQGESRETTRNTVKNGALQSKSVGHEEFKNLESRCSTVEGRAATEQLKTRSINLCSRNIHNPNRVISYQSGSLSVGDKSKMANASMARKYEVKASKTTTVRHSGNNKADATKKQITTVEKLGRPNGVSKSFISGISLDVKKSRKENPRWR